MIFHYTPDMTLTSDTIFHSRYYDMIHNKVPGLDYANIVNNFIDVAVKNSLNTKYFIHLFSLLKNNLSKFPFPRY
jgi:hypothetical protein